MIVERVLFGERMSRYDNFSISVKCFYLRIDVIVQLYFLHENSILGAYGWSILFYQFTAFSYFLKYYFSKLHKKED